MRRPRCCAPSARAAWPLWAAVSSASWGRSSLARCSRPVSRSGSRRFRPSARSARSIPRQGWRPTPRCSASDSLPSSPASAPPPSCSPPGRWRAAAWRVRGEPPGARAWHGWPRAPAPPFPRSPVSASRLNPAAAAPRCQCTRRSLVPRWPSRSSPPRSPLAAGSPRWSPIPRCTAGTGITPSKAAPSPRKPCRCWATTGWWQHGAACHSPTPRSTVRSCRSSSRASTRR